MGVGYLSALYRQVEWVINGVVYRRGISIADYKTCGSSVVLIDRLIQPFNSFIVGFRRGRRVLRRRIEDACNVRIQGDYIPEVYGTVMWFRVPDPSLEVRYSVLLNNAAAYDYIIDLDIDDNPWLEDADGLARVSQLAEFITNALGLEPSILVSRGVQLRVSLLPIHASINRSDWASIIVNALPEVHGLITIKLAEEFMEKYGTRLIVDTRVYDKSRVTRLDYSIHNGIKAYSIPFNPRQLKNLTLKDVRRLQNNAIITRGYNGHWGRIINPTPYINILNYYLKVKGTIIQGITITSNKTQGGWRRIIDPKLGELEYDTSLNGFGWVQVLVRNRIPISDGRMTMAWAVLPVAIKGAKDKNGRIIQLITLEEAIEWLKACITKYPNQNRSIEDYVNKLNYSLRYGERYNIPTWRHLIREEKDNGSPIDEAFKHIKYPIINALTEAGYIKHK